MYRKGYGSVYQALTAKHPQRKNLLARWEFTNPKGYIVPNLVMSRPYPYVNLIRTPENLSQSFTFGDGKLTDNCEIGPDSYVSATHLELQPNELKVHRFSGMDRAERVFSIYARSTTKETQYLHLGLNDNFSLPLPVDQDWVRLSHSSIDSHSSLTVAGHANEVSVLLYGPQFEQNPIPTDFQRPYLDIRLDRKPVIDDAGLMTNGLINLVGSDIVALSNYTIYFVLKHTKDASKNKKQILLSVPNWYANLQNADKQFGIVHSTIPVFNDSLTTDDDEYHVWALTYNGLFYNIYWDHKLVLTQDYSHLKLHLNGFCRLFEFAGAVNQGSLYAEYHDQVKIAQISRLLAGFTRKSRYQSEKIIKDTQSGLQSLISK